MHPPNKRPLIVPIESKVRELESKLLLACVAAERGFPVILGSRTDIHLRMGFLPRGVYLAKGMAPSAALMLNIIHKLGHEIVAWAEDSLVHAPPDEYFKTRISASALRRTSMLFAWGQDNEELFRQCPAYHGVPIHVTGNPRVDLLRPELRSYFDEETAAIRNRFGSFVLVNTNFAKLNHYTSYLGSTEKVRTSTNAAPEADSTAARAAHYHAIFRHFQELVPSLAATFPDHTIIVRPHPAENHEPWRAVAARNANVRVVLEGNVIPWLITARATIHNACTTAVESFILRAPTISYHPITSDRFDLDLPSSISYRAFNFEQLCKTLRSILDGEVGPCDDPDQWRLIERHVSAIDGPLASDRIVDVLERAEITARDWPRPGAHRYLSGWLYANLRAALKTVLSRVPGGEIGVRYQRHRFPGLGSDELQARTRRLQRRLGRFADLRWQEISKNIFQIAN